MRRVRAALARIIGLGTRQADDERMGEEMAFHLERLANRYIKEGFSPEEARRRAAIEFGGYARQAEAARDARRARWLEDAARDLRHGWRALVRKPAFGATAVLTMALAIAAAVTVFTIVDSIYLRPLPAPHADRLVSVELSRGRPRPIWLGRAGAQILQTRATAFDAIAAHDSRTVLFVSGHGASSERFGAFVTPSYFDVLGVRPYLGRFFQPSEDSVPDRDAVAVIGYDLWRAQFGGGPDALGEHMQVRGRDVTIIGVAPPGFVGLSVGGAPNQVWLPTMMLGIMGETCLGQPGCGEATVIARLRAGTTLAQAESQIAAMAPALSQAALGKDTVARGVVTPLRGMAVEQRNQYLGFTRLLGAIAILIVVIACANLGGLLVTRGIARAPEIALRYSLGAGRGRVVRQLMAENLLIGLMGGGAGVLLSIACSQTLMGFFTSDSEGFPHFFYLGLNLRVLAFALLASVVAVLLFGLAPAFATSRVSLAQDAQGARIAGRGRGRGRLLLTASQVALSLTLLAGAGLLTRSFDRVMKHQQFDPSHVALLRLRPQMLNYDGVRAERFMRDVVRGIEALPGVSGLAFARGIGYTWTDGGGTMPLGRTERDTLVNAYVKPVSPGFFGVLRIPVLAGREFSEQDTPTTPLVAVVTAALADKLWPHASPIGQTITTGGKTFQVVGLVPDYTVHTANVSPPPIVAIPYWQNAFGPEVDARLAVRVRGDPVAMLPQLRRVVSQVDPAVPVTEMLSMEAQVGLDNTPIHLGGSVLLAASLVALFLTALGLYGVIAYIVQQRTREIGVRIAVGASPRQIVTTMLRHGVGAAMLGGAAGLAIALFSARLLGAFLVGINPWDAAPFAFASGSVLAAALIASYLPARRAAKLDPMTALRAE